MHVGTRQRIFAFFGLLSRRRPEAARLDGNWGDEERSEKLRIIFAACCQCRIATDIYGVRYPDDAIETLNMYGARYFGWLPNAHVPDVFAHHLATVHVPRRVYTERLPGIPTIRVFEALACGIPLVSAPWEDTEDLFRPGEDLLLARSPAEMLKHLLALKHDAALRQALATNGLATIRSRHTCRHRVEELLRIVDGIRAEPAEVAA